MPRLSQSLLTDTGRVVFSYFQRTAAREYRPRPIAPTWFTGGEFPSSSWCPPGRFSGCANSPKESWEAIAARLRPLWILRQRLCVTRPPIVNRPAEAWSGSTAGESTTRCRTTGNVPWRRQLATQSRWASPASRRRTGGPALPRWASTDKIAMVSDYQPIRPGKKEPHFCQ